MGKVQRVQDDITSTSHEVTIRIMMQANVAANSIKHGPSKWGRFAARRFAAYRLGHEPAPREEADWYGAHGSAGHEGKLKPLVTGPHTVSYARVCRRLEQCFAGRRCRMQLAQAVTGARFTLGLLAIFFFVSG